MNPLLKSELLQRRSFVRFAFLWTPPFPSNLHFAGMKEVGCFLEGLSSHSSVFSIVWRGNRVHITVIIAFARSQLSGWIFIIYPCTCFLVQRSVSVFCKQTFIIFLLDGFVAWLLWFWIRQNPARIIFTDNRLLFSPDFTFFGILTPGWSVCWGCWMVYSTCLLLIMQDWRRTLSFNTWSFNEFIQDDNATFWYSLGAPVRSCVKTQILIGIQVTSFRISLPLPNRREEMVYDKSL